MSRIGIGDSEKREGDSRELLLFVAVSLQDIFCIFTFKVLFSYKAKAN